MAQRRCPRISGDRLIKRSKDQRIVVVVTDHICDDPPVIEIKDCAKIHFMLVLIFIIPFELSDIRQPFFIGLISCELPVQDVLSNELRISCLPCASVVGIFYSGFNSLFTADPKDTFVIYLYIMIPFQIISNTSITFIWALCM